MKLERITIPLGVIVSIFGGIFHLQGQGVIGPQSSFMYSNPSWITYGIQIATVGISIIVISIVVKKLSRS